MNISKTFGFILNGMLALCIPSFCYTMSEDQQKTLDIESTHFLDDLEDPFLDIDDDDPFISEFLDTVGAEQLSRVVNPRNIMNLLNQIGAVDLLQEDFFLRTNQLNKRSPLDEPLFEPDRAEFPGNWVVGAHVFARKMNRANFTAKSTNLSSYLALKEPTLLDRLQNSIDELRDLLGDPRFNIDFVKIFSLFENMTVEERRGGVMFHLMKKRHNMTFRFLVPIYYLERNFFLTEPEQRAVEAEFGALEPEEQERFQKAHFISDKFGVGDSRLEIDVKVLKRPSFSLRVGGQTTIPTAFAWGKGFKGSSFPRPSTFPTFDFDELFELAEEQTEENAQRAFVLLNDFFLGALDRLAANFTDTKLGNDGHVGIGIFIRGKTKLSSFINKPWAQRIALTNRISLEYLTPAHEKRFYINKINSKEFDKRDFENLDNAVENLTFLEEQFVKKFYIRAFNTKIQPGVIFRWSSKASYQGRKWGWNLGTDLWLQDKETFNSIKASDQILDEINVSKAKPPMAWQSKILGSVVYKLKHQKRIWYLSLNADTTYSRRGIGKDYALSFNFEASF